ncbi:unnamed protein product [Clavelina lepadiformis]|uniref:FERM domain-containing protein n=1 Tax=Clavelina lepadiformis TaxID=159417 RepID=A0ABP0GFN9_CLALP
MEKNHNMTKCTVALLDESEIEINVRCDARGSELFHGVCKYLNIIETDYFGFKFTESTQENVWVCLDKPLKKQINSQKKQWKFSFAVKYYPTDPSYLREEITKYQICLQIRDDLMNGRLPCPLDTLAVISSYWLQSEFGEEEAESAEVKKYLTSLRYVDDKDASTPGFEEKVERLYKSRHGMPASDADTQFLRLASNLPLYGVHRYVVEDKDRKDVVVGIGSSGIFDISDKQKPVLHKWRHIASINHKKNKLLVKLQPTTSKEKPVGKVYAFKSATRAKEAWKNVVEQHKFFRVTSSDTTSITSSESTPELKTRKVSTKRKLNFRLSFRQKKPKTEAEVRKESAKIKRPNPTVIRHSSVRRSASSGSDKSPEKTPPLGEKPGTSKQPDQDEKMKETEVETTPTLKSILKTHANGVAEEDGPRPFMDEDFFIEEIRDHLQGSCSLLLTETIPEEDEEQSMDGHYVEETTVKEISTPLIIVSADVIDEGVSIDFSKDSMDESPQKHAVTEESTLLVETNEVCHDDRHVSSSPEAEMKLVPPFITQTTKEEIIPHTGIIDANDAGKSEGFTEQEEQKETEVNPEQTSDSLPNKEHLSLTIGPFDNETSPYATGNIEEKVGNYDDEEDRKTVGASSSVAVLGDDDVTVRDLVDDVTIGDLSEEVRGRSEFDESFSDDNSEIAESSASSFSDITDNTEVLCNPNILDIIWEKCSALKDTSEPYHKLFGIKLRHVKGRSRNVKSSFYSTEHNSVATQIPTPPPTLERNLRKHDKEDWPKYQSSKFIPSWPFDPESLASNIELDELDRDAIKAALQAQKELTISNPADQPVMPLSWGESTKEAPNEEDYNDGTSRTVAESIPGIPSFVKSVGKADNNSDSVVSSRPASGSSGDSSKQLAANLVYPPNIKRFSAGFAYDVKSDVLEYRPQIDTSSLPLCDFAPSDNIQPTCSHPAISLTEDDSGVSPVVADLTSDDESTAQSNDENNLAPDEVNVEPRFQKVQAKPKVKGAYCETNESGRSTPSSAASESSFPRFVQSVFFGNQSPSSSLPGSNTNSMLNTTDANNESKSDSIYSLSDDWDESATEISKDVLPGDEEKSDDPDDLGSITSERVTIIAFIEETSAPAENNAIQWEENTNQMYWKSTDSVCSDDTLPYVHNGEANDSSSTQEAIKTDDQNRLEETPNSDETDDNILQSSGLTQATDNQETPVDANATDNGWKPSLEQTTNENVAEPVSYTCVANEVIVRDTEAAMECQESSSERSGNNGLIEAQDTSEKSKLD